MLMWCFYLAIGIVARLMRHFRRVKVGGSSSCNVCAFLELSCFDIFLSVSITESTWLFASLKSSQWNNRLHPRVVVKVFWEKAFFEIVDCLFFGILLMALLVLILVDKEMIFLALILELISNLWIIMFILVPGRWLQWEFPLEPIGRLFALPNFLFVKEPSTCVGRRSLFFKELEDMALDHVGHEWK